MKYVISQEQGGRSVKDILRLDIGLSAAFIKHLKFLENGILLNGSHVTVRGIVNAGDILELALEDTQSPEHLTPTDLPLDVIYEDDCVIVPNKPPFMPTHPSHLHHGDTLADALAFIYSERGIPFVFRPINRLDRNTSGLTLIAKNRISAAKLTESMKNGLIKKQYVAILDGEPKDDNGVIENYMRRTEKSVIVREVCDANGGGSYALTHYRTLCRKDGYSLVLATPITGRTHQLRVHFASLGCPIVGDTIYGKSDPRIPRHALHAVKLRFPHPSDMRDITVSAELPEDMRMLSYILFGECMQELLNVDFFNSK